MIPVAIIVIRLLATTWRVRRVNPAELDHKRARREPVVFAFWHGQILPLMYAHRHEGITVMISEHTDGEMIARIARHFGFPAVRGSSTRGALRALMRLVAVVRAGVDVAITPDGPRGPARSFAPGVLIAAERSGAPLVTIAAHASRAWHLRTWDRFVIPKPFATISVAYGMPQLVTAEGAGERDSLSESFRLALNDTCALAGEL